MNRTKIEYVDYTWNPVTGCKHDCSYCYARRIAERFKGTKAWQNGFEPTIHSERFIQPDRVKPSRIFVCSMADLFGTWVPDWWIRAVLETVERCPQHTFIFLTKNPKRLAEFNPWPGNAWVGTSIDTVTRAHGRGIDGLGVIDAPVRFLSMEPLLTAIPGTVPDYINWIVIGQQTPIRAATTPKREWIEDIECAADAAGVPVFEKNNLAGLFPERPLRQERPK